ncbi:hypothetical protein BTA51_27330 [Hahella sp. CCB-MM4]|nr:hypothetical protein BTA51_27330 [Hahella sp. CCB-MM4]
MATGITVAQADEGASSVSDSQPTETVIIGVEAGSYFPHYDDSTGEYEGFGRALLDEFARYAGIELEYRIHPLKRLAVSAISGQVSLRYPDNPYWEADLKEGTEITYSHPIVTYVDGTMVPPNRLGQGLDNFYKLGTVSGFTPWPYFAAIDEGKITVSENNSRTGLLHQVLMGRLDGAYLSIVVANHQLTYGLEQPGALIFDPTLPYKKSHYHLSTSTRPDLIRKFNAFLREESARVVQIKSDYRVEEGLSFIPDY